MKEEVPHRGTESSQTDGMKCRSISVRTKILLMLAAALFIFGAAAGGISYHLYMEDSIKQHMRLGEGTANLAASVINPERVEEYLTEGHRADGYVETKQNLYSIRDSSVDILYVYVYQIREDGCHVVFDLDTAEMEGASPGTVIPFDQAFEAYVPDLLAGRRIEPVISDETYGWLLTVYVPVYDSQGVCQCYAAVDISMNGLREYSREYLSQLAKIFLALFLVILLAAYWLAKNNLIVPINTMARATGDFAFHSEEAMERSLDEIHHLNIRTGDEIENLYRAFVQMMDDSVRSMEDIRHKNETISTMQRVLIMTLADMVERRDENTGQHIKKTAAYVRIILEEMQREGLYPDTLTREYIENVVTLAPLHDVGKISVPDAILNKPGKLTDEEFTLMKGHSAEGGRIIDGIIQSVPGSEYLREAQNLATYHHEKWNGRGYPQGLSGEEIPLSARVMAVADVFDALVSTRSYKKGFPYEKALGIIREERGAQFDPQVVDAFFACQETILQIADKFGGQETRPEGK